MTPAAAATAAVAIGMTTDFAPLLLAPRASPAGCLASRDGRDRAFPLDFDRVACRALLEVADFELADFEPADFGRVVFELPDLALADRLDPLPDLALADRLDPLRDLALVDRLDPLPDLALVDRLDPLPDFAVVLFARDDPLDDDFRWALGAVLLGDERVLA